MSWQESKESSEQKLSNSDIQRANDLTGSKWGWGRGDTFSYGVILSFGFLSLQGRVVNLRHGSHLPNLKSPGEEPTAFLVQGN